MPNLSLKKNIDLFIYIGPDICPCSSVLPGSPPSRSRVPHKAEGWSEPSEGLTGSVGNMCRVCQKKKLLVSDLLRR